MEQWFSVKEKRFFQLTGASLFRCLARFLFVSTFPSSRLIVISFFVMNALRNSNIHHQQQQAEYHHQQQEATTSDEEATSIDNNQQSPPFKLATNKNGLLLSLQKEILRNVWRYQGIDDFVRDVCNVNPLQYGTRNSSHRKACLQ
jgi:hypothetical protein